MLTAEALISWMTGTGIAVNARQRWRRLPVGDNLRFVDAHSIAELRARYPEWRAHSLAPASIIDAVPSLTSISDKSLDYIVGYHVLMDAKNVSQAFDSAARILKYGGTLVIPVPDAHYISDAGLETMFIIEALKRFGEDIENDTLLQIDSLARTVARISVSQRAVFDLELIGRFGLENIIIFRRKRDTFVLKTGDLVEREGAVYVVDGSEIRYVPSWETLERIKEGNHILPLNKDEYSQLTIGVPFVDADIPHILHAKRVNDK
jgi:hypothetical protein